MKNSVLTKQQNQYICIYNDRPHLSKVFILYEVGKYMFKALVKTDIYIYL